MNPWILVKMGIAGVKGSLATVIVAVEAIPPSSTRDDVLKLFNEANDLICEAEEIVCKQI